MENITDALLAVNVAGRIVYGNEYICAMLGYTREEFQRLKLSDTYDPAEALLASVRLLAAEVGEPARCERRMRRKDGTFLPVEIKYVRLPDGTAIGIVRDVTAQRRAEQRLHAELAVTRILAHAVSFTAAGPRLVQEITESIGWDFGALWQRDRGAAVFRCSALWQRRPEATAWFARATWQRSFAQGVGTIGRVWASGAPVWLPDVSRDASFPRAPVALHDGLRSACAFPILAQGDIVAAIEFLSRDLRDTDAALLEIGAALATQIGGFIERRLAVDAIAESDRLLSVAFHHAPDGVFLARVDPVGGYTVLCVNHTFLRWADVPETDVVGQSVEIALQPTAPSQLRAQIGQAIAACGRLTVRLASLRHARSGVALTILPIPGGDGEVEYILGSVAP